MSKSSRRGRERRGQLTGLPHREQRLFPPFILSFILTLSQKHPLPSSLCPGHWLFSALIGLLHPLLPSQNLSQVSSSLEPCILCLAVSEHTECGDLWALPLRSAHPGTLTLHELSLSADSILPEIRECRRCPVDNNWIPQSK